MVAKPKTFKKNISGLKIQHYLNSQRKALQACYEVVPSGDPETIHQARVKARRWAGVCNLLQDALGKGNAAHMARSARKFGRRLAKVRSLDVCLQLAKSRGGLRHPGPRLTEALIQQRNKQWKKAQGYFAPDTIQKLFGVWKTRPCRSADRNAVLKNIVPREESWIRRYNKVKGRPSEKRWHKLRIATKKWRYALEAATDLGISNPRRTVSGLKKLQAVLGQAHDEIILRQWIERAGAKDKNQSRVFVRHLDKNIGTALAQAGKIAKDIL